MKVLKIICTLFLFYSIANSESQIDKNLISVLNWNTGDLLKTINNNLKSSKCETQCCLQINHYIDNIFKSDWATIMFDASSKVQAGILYGNLYELGSFDECISISSQTEVGFIKGKYCMGKIKIPDWLFPKNWNINKNKTLSRKKRDMMLPAEDLTMRLKFAFCVPASCSSGELKEMVDMALTTTGLNADFIEGDCRVDKKQDVKAVDIFAIILLSIVGLLVVLSTTYDLYLRQLDLKTKYPILICFSLYTNGYHLFKVTPKTETSGILNSLVGLRFLSMGWIVYAHVYFIAAAFPIFNYMDSDKFVRSFSGQLIVGSSITVDTFLVMSGLLVSYTLLRQFQHGIKLKNIPFIYLHRYIRITPPYAIMILIQVSIVKFFGSGPLWDSTFRSMSAGCEKYWWSSLLYVQNYVNPTNVCLGQSWYLSVDMQLFWIAPLLMICIKKFSRFTYIIIGIIIVLLVIIIFIIATKYSILAGLIAGTRQMALDRQIMMYIPTHARATPWLIGLALGYFLHFNQEKRIVMHPIAVTIGWITSFLIMFAVIFGMYPLMQSGHEHDFGDSAYLAISRPAWGIAIAWIILACENGYGGPINWFLTLPFFQPLARLSYCEYLVHFVLQTSVGGLTRAPIYFTNFQMFYKMFSDLCCSLIFAAILALLFESPMIIIEKTIFGKAKKPIKQIKGDENQNRLEKS